MSKADKSPAENLFTLVRERLNSLNCNEQDKFRTLLFREVTSVWSQMYILRLLEPRFHGNWKCGSAVVVDYENVDTRELTVSKPLACVPINHVLPVADEVVKYRNSRRCRKQENKERDKEIRAAITAGLSNAEIKKKLGLKSRDVVKGVRRRMGKEDSK